MDHPSALKKSFGLSVAIIVGGVVIALAMYLTRVTPSVPTTQLSAALPEENPEKISVSVEEDDPILGQGEAPVTVIMFSDFECQYCREWHQATLPALQHDYLDSGKARLVFKDFPLSQLHPHAQQAAEAAHCAHQQARFWEYAQALTEVSAGLNAADLRQYADKLDLDGAAFDRCLTTHEQAEIITQNVQAGIQAGITSTPAFVVNGELLEGAQSIEVLGAAITVAEGRAL